MENEPREGCASLIKKRQKASKKRPKTDFFKRRNNKPETSPTQQDTVEVDENHETKITQTLNSHFKAYILQRKKVLLFCEKSIFKKLIK
jgi:hypothetical protein